MFNGRSPRDKTKLRVVLLSTDVGFIQAARSVFGAKAAIGLSVVESGLTSQSAEREIASAAIAIVDIRSSEQLEDDLTNLQHLISRVDRDVPIVAVVDTFNESVARKLVQMRVVDILVKPIAPTELLRACARVVHQENEETQIFTFLPVAGGVGTTTLAIQSALTLLDDKARKGLSTCLVDLNLNHGACAEYLDLEPRLDLKEIESNPERLDGQLLEGMVSHHPSGLAVVAAPSLPIEPVSLTPNIIMGLLNVVCQCFDQIVIDMPIAWHPWTDNIVLGSNRLFLTSEATVPGVRKAAQLVQAISAKLGQRPQPNVIVNRFERRFLFSPGLRVVDIRKALGQAFACTVPYNRKLVCEAIDRGIPINEIRKGNDVAAAIKGLINPRRSKSSAIGQSQDRPSPTLDWAWRGHA
jgi:pilus assembly protein CpaE